MLPARYRLKSDKDIVSVVKSRKSAYSKAIGMKVRENRLPHSRFGVVVGLKVHKRAVKRNLVKRRLREIIRKHLGSIRPGFDVMVMAMPKAVETDFAQLEEQLVSATRKLGLFAKSA